MMRVVGVIGGGAAGLCAARHLQDCPGLRPVVWEQSGQVGGTWVYTHHTGTDKHGFPIHSSMYKNLKTNLPREVMGFPDFPFPSEGPESFLHHTEVLKYLENYADHFHLRPYINLNHHVERVKPIIGESGTSWAVTVQDLTTKTSTMTTCDALVVCNGHYSVPRVPEVRDIERYKGKQVHSHTYREPTPYTGLSIVVLGAAASGLDISLELAAVAKEVIISHNLPVPIPSKLPDNVRQARGVVAALEDGFVFADGSSAKADAILYCTGYEFSFPFLDDECGIRIEDNIVKHLYKHIINTAHPTMGFIGIPFQICPFPLFDFQVRYFVAVLTGMATLKSEQEMNATTLRELEHRRSLEYPDKHYHMLGFSRQEYYLNKLAQEMKAQPFPSYYTQGFKATFIRAAFSLVNFKQYRYEVQDGQLKASLHGKEINLAWDLGWLILSRVVIMLWYDLPSLWRAAATNMRVLLRRALAAPEVF